MPKDISFLAAALKGYEHSLAEMEARIEDIMKELGGRSVRAGAHIPRKRKGRRRQISAAARKRIGDAVRRRWAAWRKSRKSSWRK